MNPSRVPVPGCGHARMPGPAELRLPQGPQHRKAKREARDGFLPMHPRHLRSGKKRRILLGSETRHPAARTP